MSSLTKVVNRDGGKGREGQKIGTEERAEKVKKSGRGRGRSKGRSRQAGRQAGAIDQKSEKDDTASRKGSMVIERCAGWYASTGLASEGGEHDGAKEAGFRDGVHEPAEGLPVEREELEAFVRKPVEGGSGAQAGGQAEAAGRVA